MARKDEQDNESRISERPEAFTDVYNGLMAMEPAIKEGSLSVEEGTIVMRAYVGAGKILETDLHARAFAYKILQVAGTLSGRRAIEAR